jgi:hypothetical protein
MLLHEVEVALRLLVGATVEKRVTSEDCRYGLTGVTKDTPSERSALFRPI